MKLLTLTAALLATTATHAALVTETYGPVTVNTSITDNEPVLTSFVQSITTSAIVSLTEVSISFELKGTPTGNGWASDMLAMLLKSPVGVVPTLTDPSAVLLNGVGITVGNPVGFGYDGWSLTLKDSAANDIHAESFVSGVLTGTFQPDGRLAATDLGRPAMLSAFNGGSGNGDWHLNIGDLAEGGTMQLTSWSLTLTGEVPEASTWFAGLGLAGALAATWWRARRRA